MQKKWCVKFLLPLRYNDGTLIEPEKFNLVREELLENFKAFTIAPFSFEGGWIDPEDNIVYFDRTKQFEVTVDITPEIEKFFVDYKEILKERFKQREIYMLVETVHKV